MKKILMIFLSVLFIVSPITIYSHPGRTDADGGHWDRSNGTYHYHNDGYDEDDEDDTSTSYSSTIDSVEEAYKLKEERKAQKSTYTPPAPTPTEKINLTDTEVTNDSNNNYLDFWKNPFIICIVICIIVIICIIKIFIFKYDKAEIKKASEILNLKIEYTKQIKTLKKELETYKQKYNLYKNNSIKLENELNRLEIELNNQYDCIRNEFLIKYNIAKENLKKEYFNLECDLKNEYMDLVIDFEAQSRHYYNILKRGYKSKEEKFAKREENILIQEEVIDSRRKSLNELHTIINEKEQAYPFLAELIADYECQTMKSAVTYLETKSRPAPTAAEVVKTLQDKHKDTVKHLKELEHQIKFYEYVFPWLKDFKNLTPDEALNKLNSLDYKKIVNEEQVKYLDESANE